MSNFFARNSKNLNKIDNFLKNIDKLGRFGNLKQPGGENERVDEDLLLGRSGFCKIIKKHMITVFFIVPEHTNRWKTS